MRLVLFASVASLLLGGCTRDNPAFGASTATGGETLGPIGDGDGDGHQETSTSTSTEESTGVDTIGDGDGDGDGPDLPDCVDGFAWVAIPMFEDNFVQNGPDVPQAGCLLGVGEDPGGGGSVPYEYGPVGVPCSEINFGATPEHWLATSGEGRTGYLGRVDFDGWTARGIQIDSAHYKFTVADAQLDTEVWVSLAPIRDDQADWVDGDGDGVEVLNGESANVYRISPYAWDGNDAFAVVDLSNLLQDDWLPGWTDFEVEVPYGRVQGWLDQEGRFDPGFMLWTDVVEPMAFSIYSADGDKSPGLWIHACYGD